MNQLKEQVKPVVESAKVVINFIYFLGFVYGAYHFFNNFNELTIALELAKK